MAMAAMLPEHASCEWWCVDTDVDGSGRVFINSTVTAIPDYAFRSCDSLVSIDLSGATALEAIGSRAFWDCDSLVSVNFTGATALEWIGERAFEDCDSLVSVNFTGATALESIGGYTFRSCDSLVSVDLSGATALESIGSFSFWGTPAATSGSICWWNEINPPDAAGRVAMSSDMVAIPVGAYASCSAVVSLDLSGATALRSIGDEAFMDCNSLVSVDLSGATALESIGGSAFRSCESLVSIDLSGATALRSIGASAFRASSLVSIDLSDATAFRTIGNYAFRDIQSLRTVKLPQGVANANFSGAFVGCGCPHNCPEGHFSCKGASMVDCATPQCYVDEITYAQDGRQQLFYWIAGPVLLVLVLCAYKGRLWDRDEIPYKIARPTRVPLKCCGGDDADGCTTCCWADPKEDASSCCWLSPTEPSNTADAEPGLVEDATNWDLHKLVWCGVFLRVADMLLDVAFNIINLGVVGVDNAVGVVDYCDYASDTCTATCVTNNGRGSTQEIVLNAYYGGHLISGGASAASRQCERLGGELNYFDESRDPNLFYIKYEQSGNGWPGGTADDVRTASTVFLGIGCVLTCFDVISAIVRAKADTSARCRDDPEQDAGAMSVLLDTPLYCGIRPWQFTLAISLLEDLPQIGINAIYLIAVGIGKGSGAALTITSFIFSIFGLVFSGHTVWSDWKKIKKQKKDCADAASTNTTTNPAFAATAAEEPRLENSGQSPDNTEAMDDGYLDVAAAASTAPLPAQSGEETFENSGPSPDITVVPAASPTAPTTAAAAVVAPEGGSKPARGIRRNAPNRKGSVFDGFGGADD